MTRLTRPCPDLSLVNHLRLLSMIELCNEKSQNVCQSVTRIAKITKITKFCKAFNKSDKEMRIRGEGRPSTKQPKLRKLRKKRQKKIEGIFSHLSLLCNQNLHGVLHLQNVAYQQCGCEDVLFSGGSRPSDKGKGGGGGGGAVSTKLFAALRS